MRQYREELRSGERLSKSPAQFLVGGSQVFGQNTTIRYARHKVRIPVPTRQDVHVNMFDDSRAGCATEIHSQVEPVWSVDIA